MMYPGVLYPEDRVGLGVHLEAGVCHVGAYCLRGRVNYGEGYRAPMLMNSVQKAQLAGSGDSYSAILCLLAHTIMDAEVVGSSLLERKVDAIGVAAHSINQGRSRITASEGSHLVGRPLVRDLNTCLRDGWSGGVTSPPVVFCTEAEAMTVTEIDTVNRHGWGAGDFVVGVVAAAGELYGARATIREDGGMTVATSRRQRTLKGEDPEAVARQIVHFASRRFPDRRVGMHMARLVLGGSIIEASPEIISTCQEFVDGISDASTSWLRYVRVGLPAAGRHAQGLGAATIALDARTEPHERHISFV